jgi:ATP-dependent protease Clp ATPase subunit
MKGGSARLDREPRCSGCARTREQVRLLISNPGGTVLICDECIAVCYSSLQDHLAGTPPAPLDPMKELAVTIYNHCNPEVRRMGDAALRITHLDVGIVGPVGRRRAALIRALAKLLRLPFGALSLPMPLHLILRREDGGASHLT